MQMNIELLKKKDDATTLQRFFLRSSEMENQTDALLKRFDVRKRLHKSTMWFLSFLYSVTPIYNSETSQQQQKQQKEQQT